MFDAIRASSPTPSHRRNPMTPNSLFSSPSLTQCSQEESSHAAQGLLVADPTAEKAASFYELRRQLGPDSKGDAAVAGALSEARKAVEADDPAVHQNLRSQLTEHALEEEEEDLFADCTITAISTRPRLEAVPAHEWSPPKPTHHKPAYYEKVPEQPLDYEARMIAPELRESPIALRLRLSALEAALEAALDAALDAVLQAALEAALEAALDDGAHDDQEDGKQENGKHEAEGTAAGGGGLLDELHKDGADAGAARDLSRELESVVAVVATEEVT